MQSIQERRFTMCLGIKVAMSFGRCFEYYSQLCLYVHGGTTTHFAELYLELKAVFQAVNRNQGLNHNNIS